MIFYKQRELRQNLPHVVYSTSNQNKGITKTCSDIASVEKRTGQLLLSVIESLI